MFLPSQHGFRFPNAFPSVPAIQVPVPLLGTVGIGNAAGGLCGGFVFAALDYYYAGRPVPADAATPEAGSPLFQYLVRRLIQSWDVPWGILQFFGWMSTPDLSERTRSELARLTSDLTHYDAVTLGLIRVHSENPLDLGKNHQVLAYRADSTALWRIYDPNYSGRDDVTLRMEGGEIVHSEDGPVRGVFRTKYVREEPEA